MNDLSYDALLALRAKIRAKGWRMTDYDWVRVGKIDDALAAARGER